MKKTVSVKFDKNLSESFEVLYSGAKVNGRKKRFIQIPSYYFEGSMTDVSTNLEKVTKAMVKTGFIKKSLKVDISGEWGKYTIDYSSTVFRIEGEMKADK